MKHQELIGTTISDSHDGCVVTKDLDMGGSRSNATKKSARGKCRIRFMKEPLVTKCGVPRAVVRDDACG